MKRLEDLGFEKTLMQGLGKDKKNQENIVSQKTRDEGACLQCYLQARKHFLLQAEKLAILFLFICQPRTYFFSLFVCLLLLLFTQDFLGTLSSIRIDHLALHSHTIFLCPLYTHCSDTYLAFVFFPQTGSFSRALCYLLLQSQCLAQCWQYLPIK